MDTHSGSSVGQMFRASVYHYVQIVIQSGTQPLPKFCPIKYSCISDDQITLLSASHMDRLSYAPVCTAYQIYLSFRLSNFQANRCAGLLRCHKSQQGITSKLSVTQVHSQSTLSNIQRYQEVIMSKLSYAQVLSHICTIKYSDHPTNICAGHPGSHDSQYLILSSPSIQQANQKVINLNALLETVTNMNCNNQLNH